jgi:HlyD family secretion protein
VNTSIWYVTALTTVVTVVTPLVLSGCGRSAAQSPKTAEVPARPSSIAANAGIAVTMVPVKSQLSPDNVRVGGQVIAWRTTTIAAEVSETVSTLPIEVGQKVAADGLIAQLDDAAARAVLAEAEAVLAQATAGRRQLEADYARASVETRAAVDAAKAQIAQSDAGIRQAKAQAAQAVESERKARAATRAQELAQAEASLRRAQADETLAQTEHTRYVALVREGAVAQQMLDRAKATFDAAIATREQAEQSLSLAREGARSEDIASAVAGVAQADAAIANGTAKRREAEASLSSAGTRDSRLLSLRRQIDGLRAQEARSAAAIQQARILAKLTEVGETVAAGTPIARLGEITRVKATFPVPEAARRGLRPGQKVVVTADALPGRTFTGQVYTVGYQADARARTFAVEVHLENPSEILLPNMAVRLALPATETALKTASSALTVPVSAVASDGKAAFVFTVEKGKAIRRPVTLGPVRGESVTIRSGLESGQQIVATPQRLTDGATVRVVE